MITKALRAAGAIAPMALGSIPAVAQDWNEIPLTPGIYREYPAAHRSDTVDIRVPANGGELEYMVSMKMGDSMVYSWAPAEGEGGALTSEFHGHTDRVGNEPGTLIFYRKAMGTRENGALVAPFDGIHGWYLKNDTPMPVVIRLNLSGFYEPIPNQLPN